MPILPSNPISEMSPGAGSESGIRNILSVKLDNKSIIELERAKAFFEVTERSWNVYENKGWVWKGLERSGDGQKTKGR